MKLFTLAALAATLVTMNAQAEVREHGGGRDVLWACEQFDNVSGYRVKILATPNNVSIRQESDAGYFDPIDMKVEQKAFTGEVSPAIYCEQHVRDYTIRILVANGIVQVLQSLPNAQYAPIQLEEVK